MAAILVLLLTASGCWNYRELNNLAIVAGVGIDLAGKSDRILLTVQIIKPGEVRAPEAGGGGGGKGGTVWVVSSEGATVFEAVRGFVSHSDRRLYWPHNQVIVIGKKAAQHGARPLLDFFIREHEPRPTAWVLVTDGEARELLALGPEVERIPAVEMAHLVEARASSSQAVGTTVHEFIKKLMSGTTAPVASHIVLVSQGKDKIDDLVGTSVFRDDKLAGQLDKAETRGLLWVTNQIRSGIIVVGSPGGGRASLEIIRSKSSITPRLLGGKIYVKVEVGVESNLACQMSPTDLTKPGRIESLRKREAMAVRNEIMAAFKKAKELGADIFGLGEAVHRKYPRQWSRMEPIWGRLFPQVELTVIVKTKIRNIGLTTKPPLPE